MKSLINYFIRYEILVNLAIVVIAIFGVIALTGLTSSFFPEQDVQFIIVEAVLPGASPEEVEEGITLKVEDNLEGITGIDRVTSTSTEASANIQVELTEDADVNVVLQDVKNAVDRISSFPPNLERIVVFKQEPLNLTVRFALSGDVSLKALKETAQDIEDDLRRKPNISRITLSGYTEEQIEVSVRENALRSYGISFQELAQAVQNNNLEISGGKVRAPATEITIRADNKGYQAYELQDIVVKADPDGSVVRLRDVANVRDTWSEDTDRAYLNGKRAVVVVVNTTNEEDILTAAATVRSYLEEFNQNNEAIQATIVEDGTENLQERIDLLEKNGIMGFVLVLVVLGLFLNLRVAFWVALGIPVSFLGMFVLASFYGLTINVLSLFGMILVLGILVDDGVVVGENIYQRHENGEKRMKAAINGTLEVMPAVLAAVTTTSIAFGLFFFIDGQLGEFFSDVAFVVIASLFVSLIEVSIFLPSHLAHSKALGKEGAGETKVNKYTIQFLAYLRDRVYKPTARFMMANQAFSVLALVALLIVTLGLLRARVVNVTFFPNVELNTINVSLEMPAGTSDSVTQQVLTRIQQAALQVDQQYQEREGEEKGSVVDKIEMIVGPRSSEGSVNIYLTPAEVRTVRSFDITDKIRQQTGPVPDAKTLSFGTQSPFGKPVVVSLSGENFEDLQSAKQELRSALEELETLKDVIDNAQANRPEINVTLKEKAKLLGLNLQQVMAQVRAGFFGIEAQRLQRGTDEIKVWVRYDSLDRTDISELEKLRIRTPDGGAYPLEEVAELNRERGLIAISHRDGQREISVEADVSSLEISAPDVIENIRSNILPGILEKYPNVDATFEGQVRQTRKTSSSTQQAGPVVLIAMLVVLVVSFRSVSQAIVLLLIIPFSLIGVITGHFIHGLPFSILSGLGVVALIGILLNDGLVFINTLNDRLREGMDFTEALQETGVSRFRPIVLTTVTTIAGLGPLIFESGLQAQFLIPMAVTVAYGLLIGAFLILGLLPVLLLISNKLKVYALWLWEGEKPRRNEVEHAVKEGEKQHQYES